MLRVMAVAGVTIAQDAPIGRSIAPAPDAVTAIKREREREREFVPTVL